MSSPNDVKFTVSLQTQPAEQIVIICENADTGTVVNALRARISTLIVTTKANTELVITGGLMPGMDWRGLMNSHVLPALGGKFQTAQIDVV